MWRTRSCLELPKYFRIRLKISEEEYIIRNDFKDSSEELSKHNKDSEDEIEINHSDENKKSMQNRPKLSYHERYVQDILNDMLTTKVIAR